MIQYIFYIPAFISNQCLLWFVCIVEMNLIEEMKWVMYEIARDATFNVIHTLFCYLFIMS